MSSQLESMLLQAPLAYVLGVRVDRLSQQQALDRIEQMIALHRSGGNALSCQQVVTVNTEFVMAAQHDTAFRHTINSAALVNTFCARARA
jgi:N-acetylglucosaminyldiphosphoundecaprenol N-acetyl-beta-D-mannosaminyltransferase